MNVSDILNVKLYDAKQIEVTRNSSTSFTVVWRNTHVAISAQLSNSLEIQLDVHVNDTRLVHMTLTQDQVRKLKTVFVHLADTAFQQVMEKDARKTDSAADDVGKFIEHIKTGGPAF